MIKYNGARGEMLPVIKHLEQFLNFDRPTWIRTYLCVFLVRLGVEGSAAGAAL